MKRLAEIPVMHSNVFAKKILGRGQGLTGLVKGLS